MSTHLVQYGPVRRESGGGCVLEVQQDSTFGDQVDLACDKFGQVEAFLQQIRRFLAGTDIEDLELEAK